jgi:hypothetical protein
MTDTFPRTEHTNQPQQGGSHPAPLPPFGSTAPTILHLMHTAKPSIAMILGEQKNKFL